MSRRLLTMLTASTFAVAALLGFAAPASAAVTPAQKLAALSNFTQTSVSSYNSWNSARQNQGAWAEYAFNWGTDYCSSSPDNPLGFSFELSCYRHDFGYRNYKEVGQFDPNKARLDDAFYADLQRVCATYNAFVRPACYSLAWTYYQAVRVFGAPVITQAELDKAAKLKADGERRAAAAAAAAR
ncbi:phospholipase [Plantactinospora endophytica]|uniref:Phospholipase n=1 Tax=Plantactinospora endophytica TaxID=673535 RepID=A0ABQ4DTS8_9ACTN|nr:phospholipase [Plantactinospora endophytica]GIG85532.1 hypothetical protein Pen02_04680 [Plantactinospora endophytica]